MIKKFLTVVFIIFFSIQTSQVHINAWKFIFIYKNVSKSMSQLIKIRESLDELLPNVPVCISDFMNALRETLGELLSQERSGNLPEYLQFLLNFFHYLNVLNDNLGLILCGKEKLSYIEIPVFNPYTNAAYCQRLHNLPKLQQFRSETDYNMSLKTIQLTTTENDKHKVTNEILVTLIEKVYKKVEYKLQRFIESYSDQEPITNKFLINKDQSISYPTTKLLANELNKLNSLKIGPSNLNDLICLLENVSLGPLHVQLPAYWHIYDELLVFYEDLPDNGILTTPSLNRLFPGEITSRNLSEILHLIAEKTLDVVDHIAWFFRNYKPQATELNHFTAMGNTYEKNREPDFPNSNWRKVNIIKQDHQIDVVPLLKYEIQALCPLASSVLGTLSSELDNYHNYTCVSTTEKFTACEISRLCYIIKKELEILGLVEKINPFMFEILFKHLNELKIKILSSKKLPNPFIYEYTKHFLPDALDHISDTNEVFRYELFKIVQGISSKSIKKINKIKRYKKFSNLLLRLRFKFEELYNDTLWANLWANTLLIQHPDIFRSQCGGNIACLNNLNTAFGELALCIYKIKNKDFLILLSRKFQTLYNYLHTKDKIKLGLNHAYCPIRPSSLKGPVLDIIYKVAADLKVPIK